MFHSHVALQRPINARSVKVFLILALALALGGLAATSASAAPPPDEGAAVPPPADPAPGTDPASGAGEPEVDAAAAEAMAQVKKISVAEAKTRLAREASLGARGAEIEESLRGRSGGTYLDADGNLVVTTLDRASNALVKRNGARAKSVDDTSARLDAIVKQLDRQSAKAGAGGVQGWYVDIPTNSVVVTVTEGATDAATVAMTQLAQSFGDSVRIEHRPAAEAARWGSTRATP